MRDMYDSTSPTDIPRNAQMVAYYVDGRYAWPKSWVDQFPNAVKVTISAVGQKSAMVGDVEDGCIWPPENAVDWVLEARRNGFDPTIYCNQMNDWQWVAAEFAHRNVPEPHWWVAKYDKDPTIPAGAVAKQYMHPPQIGKHYDLSSVLDYWPGVDKIDSEGDDMNAEQERKLNLLYSTFFETETSGVVDPIDGKRHTIFESFWLHIAALKDHQQACHDDLAGRITKAKQDVIDAINAEGGVTMDPAAAEAFANKVLGSIGETVKAATAEGINTVEWAPRPNTN